MKKIFKIIAGLFTNKKSVKIVVCDHSLAKFAMRYSWSEEKKRYTKVVCGGCGKNLMID